MTGADYLKAAMTLAPLVIQAGEDIAPFAAAVYQAIVRGGEPTADDWAALKAREDALRAKLQAPLPPEDAA